MDWNDVLPLHIAVTFPALKRRLVGFGLYFHFRGVLIRGGMHPFFFFRPFDILVHGYVSSRLGLFTPPVPVGEWHQRFFGGADSPVWCVWEDWRSEL